MINKNYTDCKSEEKSNGGEVDSHRRLNFGTSKFSNMNVLEALFLKSKTDVSDVNIRCKKEGDRVFSFIKLRIISVKEMGDILNHYYYKYHLTSILTSFLGKIKKKVNHVRSEKVHHLLDVALIKLGIKDYYWTHKNFYDGEILKKKNIYFKSKDESVLLEEMVMGDDERDYTDILPFILFYFIPASYIILKEKRKQIGHNFLFSASLYALFMSLLSSFKEEMIIEYSIIISSVLATIFAATTLVYKYVKYSTEILNLYTILLVITFLFTNTNNIFNFFLLYELFLLPSIYISMYYSPNRRSYSSTNFFLLWTQLGSSLFLLFALNMRFLFGYLNFFQIKTDQVDLDYLYQFFFLIGILIKVPTFPFYFWLLKTHVEAMTSFSILLSGFLVKIAILCLYKFLFLLKSLVVSIAICLSLVGSASASILFIHQIDFKKFVAYSTIQEMGLISTLLLITQSSNLRSIAVFFSNAYGNFISVFFSIRFLIQKVLN